MFVKKDLRKIPEILSRNEENDEKENQPMNAIGSSSLTELKLARRQGEFGGNLKVLCDPIYSNALANLTKLSLYDCGLHDLKGIGMLGECSRLQQLNIGSNDFTDLPAEFALLADTLEVLWMDDCKLKGPLPECIYQLSNLKSLRLPGNRIDTILSGNEGLLGIDEDEEDTSDGLSSLKNLETLSLDNNLLKSLPRELELPKLESLMMR